MELTELRTLRNWLFDMLRVRAERYGPTRRDGAAHPPPGPGADTRRAAQRSAQRPPR